MLDELDELAPLIAPDLERRARPRVAAPLPAIAWPGMRPFVEALARDLAARPAVHVIATRAAADVIPLAEASVRRLQLDEVARAVASRSLVTGTLDEVARALAADAGRASDGPDRWLQRTARSLRQASAHVIVDLTEDPRAAAVLAAMCVESDHALVAIVSEEPPAREGLVCHRAPVLDRDGARSLAVAMIGGEPPIAWLDGLLHTSSNAPAAAIGLLRSLSEEANPYAIDWATRTTAGATEQRAARLRELGDGARALAIAVAAWGGALARTSCLPLRDSHSRRLASLISPRSSAPVLLAAWATARDRPHDDCGARAHRR